jgi:glucosyl-3-phosphoglycerate phosphatase
VGARMSDAIFESFEQFDQDATVVVVTHGSAARAAIGSLIGMPADTWWRLAPLSNCRWSLLADSGRGWRLEEHNAGSPPEEETGDDAR